MRVWLDLMARSIIPNGEAKIFCVMKKAISSTTAQK